MSAPGSNLFLDSLSTISRDRMFSVLKRVELPVNTPLYEARELPTYAFFLTSGFASQVISLPGTTSVEVGLVGREGVVGSMALLGPEASPHRCFMQADGSGYRVAFDELRKLFLDSEEVRDNILSFTQAHTLASAYLSACNKLHEAECRLARWLLMVQDRLETDVLQLKQEFLAQMLGTRRETVSAAASALQRSGMIEYNRGRVRIVERKLLEAAACECYGNIRGAYSGLYSS